jgi:hypothetical protein
MRGVSVFLAVAGAALIAAAPAGAGRTILEDDHLLLRSGPATRDAALDEMSALGADTVRLLVEWERLAPAPGALRRPAGFDGGDPAAYPLGAWDGLDGAVAGAQARGLRVLVTFSGPGPAWASRCGGPAGARRTCDPRPSDFAAWVRALGRRYPSVHDWEAFNEPNAHTRLTPQWARRRGRWVPRSPVLYRGLVRASLGALRATGHGGDRVLVGATAAARGLGGPAVARPMNALVFWRTLLCCGRLAVGGLSHHPYVRGGSGDPLGRPDAPDDLTLGNVAPILRLADRAAAAGRLPRGLRLWVTEYGVQTVPPDRFLGVPLGVQARWLDASEWLVARRPRIAALTQYLLRDDSADFGFQSGLRFADGRPKPALATFPLPVWTARRGRRLEVFGRVRTAWRGPETVALEHRSPGGAWATVRTLSARPPGGVVRTTVPRRPGQLRLRSGTRRSRVVAAS